MTVTSAGVYTVKSGTATVIDTLTSDSELKC